MLGTILFIIPWIPLPLNSGGKQAILNGLLAVNKYYNIIITYPEINSIQNIEEKTRLVQLLEGNAIILPYHYDRLNCSQRSFFSKLLSKGIKIIKKNRIRKQLGTNPYSYWVNELLPVSKDFIIHVNKIINDYKVDIVQCEMLRNIAFIHSLPSCTKKIFIHHELGFVRHKQEMANFTSSKYDAESFFHCAKCLEVSQLNKYDCVVTLSSVDSQKLRDAGVNTVIKNSFAIINNKKKYSFIPCNNYTLSFVGPDKHEPNMIGVKWFLENCWATLLNIDSRYHLSIIGNWSDSNIEEISKNYDHVHFCGFVDDLESVLKNTIMIIPLTIGSGIRMKILEAAYYGIPFVSTSIGAEGIPFVHKKHCLIADSPKDFVNSIIDLQDTNNQAYYTKNAHYFIDKYYTLDALCKNRLEIYESLYE